MRMTKNEYGKFIESTQARPDWAKQVHDDMETQRRAQAGHKAQGEGEAFQRSLDTYHARLTRDGAMVRVLRQLPAMRAMWVSKQLVYKATEKGPCDYVMVFPNGIFGIFDAKATSHERQFSWPAAQQHQLDELRAVHTRTNQQAPAFALVNWYAQGETRVHPVWTIKSGVVYRAEGEVVDGVAWLDVVKGLWGVAS